MFERLNDRAVKVYENKTILEFSPCLNCIMIFLKDIKKGRDKAATSMNKFLFN